MLSYALYVNGERIGTFRGPVGSVRNISATLKRKYPHLDITKAKIAKRWLLNGKWTDGDQVQAEL